MGSGEGRREGRVRLKPGNQLVEHNIIIGFILIAMIVAEQIGSSN